METLIVSVCWQMVTSVLAELVLKSARKFPLRRKT